ncbi:NfeD family protein [Salinarimonas sp.]|uniref:NfeD family protein n=1 Tax=Salinarimonas sp. TaxID=2766526 RepID=UPI0039196E61
MRAISGLVGATLLALLAVLALAELSPRSAIAQTQAPAETYAIRTALVVDIEGGIGPATTRKIALAIEAAAAEPGGAVILRIDTPGGLDSATRDIVRAILASPVPVIAYVAPSGARAASAGTYILMASHLAGMAPSTALGAATPVAMGGGGLGGGDEAMTRKVVNDAVAFMRGLASLRARNVEFAEASVRDGATLTAAEAVQDNVAEILASDVERLLAGADGYVVRLGERTVRLDAQGAQTRAFAADWLTDALGMLANPNVAYILMLIGIYGIILEFANPGTIFSGVIGVISLVLGLYALNLLPYDATGLVLIGLGLVLMVAEALTPSFGILGIGGAVAFAFGSLMLFPDDVPGIEMSPIVAIAASAATALIVVVVVGAALRAFRRPPAAGDRALARESGRVVAWAGGTGEVEVHGERWHARAARPLEPGTRVRVIAREGLVLDVAPDAAPPAARDDRAAPGDAP